jgi:Domain of unknown function (DUF5134)
MTTPSWILDILAGVMLLVATISAGRLAAARSWARSDGEPDIDVAHLLMGIAMAGMLVASLTTLPNGVWDAVFAVLTAWFGWRVYRESRREGVRVLADGHRMPHLVHSAAMLYMFAALNTSAATGSGGGMSGMGSSGASMPTLSVPVVAFIFALWLSVYVVLDLDRLSGPGHAHGSYFAAPALASATAGTRSVRLPAAASVPAASVPAGTGASLAASPDQTADGSHPDGGGDGVATASRSRSARALLLSPQVAAGCRIAMGVTMAFMLIIMI